MSAGKNHPWRRWNGPPIKGQTMSKMPCSISDGPQTPEDVPEHIEQDGDAVNDEQRQLKIDTIPKDLVDELNENNKIMDRLKDDFNQILAEQGFMTKDQAE